MSYKSGLLEFRQYLDEKFEYLSDDFLKNQLFAKIDDLINNYTPKTGVELIEQERQEQISKHGRTVELDVIQNKHYQLSEAAGLLTMLDMSEGCIDDSSECCPVNWDESIWDKMFKKTYEERLVIAGALIAAEIDRIKYPKAVY